VRRLDQHAVALARIPADPLGRGRAVRHELRAGGLGHRARVNAFDHAHRVELQGAEPEEDLDRTAGPRLAEALRP